MNELPRLLAGPATIVLAREAPFQLGELYVRPSSLEVIHGESRHVLEPRVMQVLVELARQHGEVVSRDELIATCWGGRFIGDDAVNRAIGKLRRLAELTGGSIIIENIPRVGYRLKVDAAAAEPLPEAPSPAPRHATARTTVLVGALAVLAVVLVAAIGWRMQPVRYVLEPLGTFVATRAVERHPAFSPDGTMLAYSAGPDAFRRDIYLRRLSGGDPLRLTDEPGDESGTSFSPDGGRIAYVEFVRGRPCRILTRPVPAGPPTEVARCRASERSTAAWSPDGGSLYFSDGPAPNAPTRIYRLDLASSRRIPVTTPPAGSFGDAQPAVSPDGRQLSYQRSLTFAVDEIRVRDLASARERVMGATASAGEGWTPDSRALLTVTERNGVSVFWAYPLRGQPQRLTSTWGVFGRIAAARNGLVAAESETMRVSLVRAPLAGGREPERFDLAKGRTLCPAIAPDGAMAMTSNRSGSFAVWLMKAGEPARMFAPLDDIACKFVWSPDGSRLAFLVYAQDETRLQVVSAAGARLAQRTLPYASAKQPSWLGDGRSFALPMKDQTGWRIWKVDPFGAAPPQPLSGYGWDSVAVEGDQLYAHRADGGIWRLGALPQRVVSLPAGPLGPWRIARGAVVYVDAADPDMARLMAQPLSGGSARKVADLPGAGGGVEFSIDPSTGRVIYESSENFESDIVLFKLTRR